MARIVEGVTGQSVYPDVVTTVRSYGRLRSSRNGPVLEIPNLTIVLESPCDGLPVGCGRNLNPRIAAAEALQLIGGFSDPDWLVSVAPNFKRYREVTGEFWGAYGDRIGNQIEHVISKLRTASNTRQAVITLWNPDLDNIQEKSDYPCTVALGFMVTDNYRLGMNVTMRSNDVWLGLPYDLFQFTQLHLTLCNVLGLTPGEYTHTAWSMHLYTSDLAKSYEVTSAIDYEDFTCPDGIGQLSLPVESLWTRARMLARAPHLVRDSWDLTKSEEWYLDTLGD